MNLHPFTLGFCGYSGSGKTTLLERLIPELKQLYQLAYFKHDAHRFQMDTPGKDTYRAAAAGAQYIVIQDSLQTACLARGHLTEQQLSSFLEPAELLLVEGYKQAPWDKIILLDQELNILSALQAQQIQEVVACVGPWQQVPEQLPARIPYFQRDQLQALVGFIRRWHEQKRQSGLVFSPAD